MLACSAEVGIAQFAWYLFRNGNNDSYPYRCKDGTESLCAMPSAPGMLGSIGSKARARPSPYPAASAQPVPCRTGSGKVSGVGAFGDAWF